MTRNLGKSWAGPPNPDGGMGGWRFEGRGRYLTHCFPPQQLHWSSKVTHQPDCSQGREGCCAGTPPPKSFVAFTTLTTRPRDQHSPHVLVAPCLAEAFFGGTTLNTLKVLDLAIIARNAACLAALARPIIHSSSQSGCWLALLKR